MYPASVKPMDEDTLTIKIPKKAIRLFCGLMLIAISVMFNAVTLAILPELSNPIDLFIAWTMIGVLGVACIFWDKIDRP
jgi:hypothetical protein